MSSNNNSAASCEKSKSIISVNNISKHYQIYATPTDRLKQLISGRKKRYQDFIALDQVSFELVAGDVLGVIGRNGSGKSTLLQLITGIMQPTHGEISVAGKISALLELGTGFNPELTGRENVFLATSLMGLSHQQTQDKLDWIIQFAEIGQFIDLPVKTYSSGMFVRLAFSVAVCVSPEILIVDEALSVGDVFFQQKCLKLMREKLNASVKILVSHDLNTISAMCNKVLVLDSGKQIYFGDPLEAIEIYTKAVHSQTFTNSDSLVEDLTANKNSNDLSENSQNSQLHKSDDDKKHDENQPVIEWKAVNSDKIAGNLTAKITHVMAKSDLGQGVELAVRNNKELAIYFKTSSAKPLKNIIIGYLVNDKFGNSIFGENSLSLKAGLFDIEKENQFCLSFDWPNIRAGEYFITLGIGEGDDPLVHVIQCWAHNVIAVKNIVQTGEVIHSLFNQAINKIEKI